MNTIFCGDYQTGINTFWRDGALLGKGRYMNIDHDAAIVHISTPYDQQITNLNSSLNDTYIPYGRMGYEKKSKQLAEDANAQSLGSANSAKRVVSKGSKVYSNTKWDLVDAAKQKEFKLEEVKVEELPEEMKSMTIEERKSYVEQKNSKRLSIKTEIAELNKKREAHVKSVKENESKESQSQLDDAIVSAIIEQAEDKSFTFEDEIN